MDHPRIVPFQLVTGIRDATSRKEVSSVRGEAQLPGDNLLPFNRPSRPDNSTRGLRGTSYTGAEIQ